MFFCAFFTISDFFCFHLFSDLIFAFCHSLKCHGKKLRKLPAQLICTSLDHLLSKEKVESKNVFYC